MASIFALLSTPLCVVVLVFAFALGAVFASFIGCVASRTVAGESPWKGRSHCDSCGHVLGPLDLVPVVSWLAAGGKCRYCKAPVPRSCVVTELVLGAVFMLVTLRFGLSGETLAYMALACILLGLSLVDLETMTIPNGFVIALCVVWVLHIAYQAGMQAAGLSAENCLWASQPVAAQASLFAWAWGGGVPTLVADGLVGGLGIGGGVLLLSLGMDALLKKQSLGGGDVKLLFAVGLFLGLPLGLFNLVVSCLLGLVFAFARSAAGKPFPFGPAIAAATMVTLFVGPVFMQWYVGLLL